jgi:hypothetical protein
MADAPPPTSLIALRDRREAAIQRLTDGFAADLLTVEQFDERLARAHGAMTIAELDTLVADLEAVQPGPSTALAPLRVEPSLEASKKRLLSVFGNVERRGAWVVPGQLRVSTVFGNAELDFREARFATGVTEIHARVVFGNLEIIVPPHLVVECEGTTLFGNLESHAGAVADPDRPRLRIHGTVVFGNIEVQVRLPGESEWGAWRRRRRERKALRQGATPALPPAAGPTPKP